MLKSLNIHNLLHCTLVYLATDVIHLADILKTIRDKCINNYHLDPCHFYTSPGLSWNAMLYSTKKEFELVTRQDVLEFFESQIRGGVLTMFHYAQANDPYLPNYDKTQPTS